MDRVRFLVIAGLNEVGRILKSTPIGRFMPAPYSPAQIWTAKVIWGFWASKGCDDIGCAAWLGNTDGEDSLILTAWGDHHEAVDMVQHHQVRRDIIKDHTGIDMAHADALRQCEGVWWEITTAPSAYRHVWDHFQAASTIDAKVTVLVHELEQSGSQARDIARRTGLANYWLAYGRQHGWMAAAGVVA